MASPPRPPNLPCYAHLDMDSFFVSCEVALKPYLKGKPVAIGHDSERGVIASASYEARDHGVKSAMPVGQAKKLCRDLILIPGNFGLYESKSRDVRRICADFCPDIKVTSIDEMYLDLSLNRRRMEKYGSVKGAMLELQKLVSDELDLPCSIGVARHPILAKIATREAKPAGVAVRIGPKFKPWLKQIEVARVPGIGPKTQEKWDRLNIKTIGQLLAYPLPKTVGLMGKSIGSWQALFNSCLDEDWQFNMLTDVHGHFAQHDFTAFAAPSKMDDAAKSYSHETTFFQNKPAHEVVALAQRLLEKTLARARDDSFYGRTFTLRVRTPDFTTKTFAKTYEQTVQTSLDCLPFIKEVLEENYAGEEIRLIGTRIANREHSIQYDLFQGRNHSQDRLNDAADKLRHKFGAHRIVRGGMFGSDR